MSVAIADATVQSRRALAQIVFISPDVPEPTRLLDAYGIHGLELHLLDAARDGLVQMVEVLADREPVAAIHLFSHGAPGEVKLPGAGLTRVNLADRADALARIGEALGPDGTLLLYGCRVAAGVAGRAFVESLAAELGAAVAASDDLTGAADLGGDGDLEFQVGRPAVAPLALPDGWRHVLASGPGGIAFVGYNGDGTDGFAFIAVNSIPAGTTIFFTDNEWNGTAFNTGEGILTWTNNTGAAIAAGTVVEFTNLTGTVAASVGSVSISGSLNLGAGDEVLYAYVGTGSTTPTAFLAALANGGFSSANGDITGTGLTVGTDAINLATKDDDADIGAYDPAVGGNTFASAALALAAFNNPSNWQTQDASGNQDADGTIPDAPFLTDAQSPLAGVTITITAAADTAPPTLASSTPADDATGFAVGANIVLTFSEAIQAGTGNIVLTDLTDGTGTLTIPVGDARITISGTTLTINPAADLDPSTSYEVTFGSGVVADLAGNAFGGLTTGQLNFTTAVVDTTAPQLAASNPSDPDANATNVTVGANIVIRFTEAIQAGTGSIILTDVTGSGADTRTIAIADNQVAIVNDTLTINPTADLLPGNQYEVTIASGVVKDTAGNAFGGIANGALTFTTSVLVINEILADPSAVTGDANGDGTVDTANDEFVEIVNTGATAVDIGGFKLSDAASVRHTFAEGTVLQPGTAIVVFGGGTPTGGFGTGTSTVAASSGSLGLGNGGDTVTLADSSGTPLATVTYGSEGGNDTSLTRNPDLTGAFVQHTSLNAGARAFSPGVRNDGTGFVTLTNTLTVAADAAANQAEGNSGTTAFTFTVTRGDASGTASVEFAVTGSGAFPASAADFDGGVLPTGTVSFGTGETTKTITVFVATDTVHETDETFTVTLSNPTNATIVTATATGTIQDDDPSLTAGSIAFVSVNTDNSGTAGTGKADSFSFVALQDLAAGTQIRFTDTEWLGTAFATDEANLVWVATSAVTKGTLVTVEANTTPPAVTGGGSLSGTGGGLSGTLETLFAYQGAQRSPTATFLAGAIIGTETFASSPSSDDGSALPPGLTVGFTAVQLGSGDNQTFNGPTTGSKGQLLVSLANPTNFTSDNSNLLAPPAAFTVTTDTTAPTLVTSTPADGATAQATNVDIVLTFSEVVKAGSGTIVLDATGTANDITIAVTDPQVTVSGTTVTINPTADLAAGVTFDVLVPDTAFTDLDGNTFAGLTAGQLDFATAASDVTPPGLSSSVPADEATLVDVNADIVLTFSEAVKAGSGTIVLDAPGDANDRTIPVGDAQVTVNGTTVTINPTAALAPSTAYNVILAPGTIQDAAGNGFGGLVAGQLNFTTDVAFVAGQQLAFFSFNSLATAPRGDLQAIYPDKQSASFADTSQPVVFLGGGVIDADGSQGTAFTDGNGFAPGAGTAATFAPLTVNVPDPLLLVSLATTGYRDLSLRYDVSSTAEQSFDIAFSVDNGVTFTTIASNKTLVTDGAFQTLTFDLSPFTAIENAPSVLIQIDDLDDQPGTIAFDNLEITGSFLGASAPGVVAPPASAGLVPSTPVPVDQPQTLSLAGANGSVTGYTVLSTNSSVFPAGSIAVGSNGVVTLQPATSGLSVVTLIGTGAGKAQIEGISFLVGAAKSGGAADAETRFHFGPADSSTAIALDATLMLVGDDETATIRLYNRTQSGPALASFDFGTQLALGGTELDLEGSTRVGDTIFWIGSHSNTSGGDEQASRERLFATTVAGTGGSTTLTFAGSYGNLATDLVAWDVANTHGLGPNFFGFQAAEAGGRAPEAPNGFSIEGLTTSADGSQLWLGFRAPLEGAAVGGNALIVPVTNYTALLNGSQTVATFGAPIRLDLDGRGIRSIDRNGAGDYLILAGPPGSATGAAPSDFVFYTWNGNPASAPVLRTGDLNTERAQLLGSFESIVEVPASLTDTTGIQVFQDNGDSNFYGTDIDQNGDFPLPLQLFRSDVVTLGAAVSPPTATLSLAPGSVAEDGTDTLVFTVTLGSAAPTGGVTVTYGLSGTATAGTDFASVSGAVLIAAGATTATVTIDPTADTTVEPDETVVVTLTAGNGYVLGGAATSTGTILNDDQTVPPQAVPVINEFHADTAGTDTAEFIELFGPANGSLGEYTLVLFNGNDDKSYLTFDLTGKSFNADGLFVIGNPAVTSALPSDRFAAVNVITQDPGSGGFLQNGADAIALYKAAASAFPNGTAVTATGLVDAVVYGTSDANDAGLLAVLTPGQVQPDDDAGDTGDTKSLSRPTDGEGGPLAASSFVAATPTPGVAVPGAGTSPPPPPLDQAGPVLKGSMPADNAAAVATTASIVLTFDEGVKAGTGNIVLDAATGPDIVIPVGDAQVKIDGSTVTIDPVPELSPGVAYDVLISAGTFTDLAGNPFAGLATDALDFTVSAAPPPPPPPQPAAIVINEISADHTGTDTKEFIEIFGPANADVSGLALLVIEGEPGGIGVIDAVFTFGSTTDANGFALAVPNTGGFINSVLENGSQTYLLVSGFTGTKGTDLDTDDDGFLDSTPWTGVVDAVAVLDAAGTVATHKLYAPVILDKTFDDTLVVSDFEPGGFSRIPNGADTGTAADFVRNDFDLAGIVGFTGTQTAGEAGNTPAAANATLNAAANAADTTGPVLVASTPADGGALSNDANLVLVFNEGIALAGAASETLKLTLSNGAGDTREIALTDSTRVTLFANLLKIDPGADLAAGTTYTLVLPAGAVTDSAGNPFAGVAAGNLDFQVVAGSASVSIGQIQGEGHTSPFVGLTVGTTGIVTAKDSNGFYLQDPTGDGNVNTSDGIFVFTGGAPTVSVGDSIALKGTVGEVGTGTNLTITQITAPTDIVVLSSGNAVQPIVIGAAGRSPPTDIVDDDRFAIFDPDKDGIDFYESLEGMLVTVASPRATAPGGTGGIFVVSDDGVGTTGLNSRGGLTLGLGDGNPERIQVDDDSGIFATTLPTVDTGTKLNDITGVLTYTGGLFELAVTQPVTVRAASTFVPEVTTLAEPDTVSTPFLTVAGYNVENLDPGDDRFFAIAAQIVNNLGTPDIIALVEVQDNDGATNSSVVSADLTLRTLVDAIAQTPGGVAYQFIDNGFIVDDTNGGEPGGNIRTAFLYNPARVTPSGAPVAVPDPQGDPIGSSANVFFGSRVPLAQTFGFNGQDITVVAVHNTSRGGSDPQFGTVQPPANAGAADRLAQSSAIADFVTAKLAQDPAANIVVLGDFNAFAEEPELTVLAALPGETGGPLNNLTLGLLANGDGGTLVFQGQSQDIDHILVSDNLLKGGAEVDGVHINIDFNPALPNRIEVSDHDPLVVRLNLPAAPSQLSGTAGDDTLIGTAGSDTIEGLAGNDTIDGGPGNDSLLGGAGEDNLRGGGDGDVLRGGDGADDLDGGAGNDTLDGGANAAADAGAFFPFDTVRYFGKQAGYKLEPLADLTVRVTDIDPVDGDTGIDILVDVEAVGFDDAFLRVGATKLPDGKGGFFIDGTVFADTLTGGSGDDRFNPGPGSAVIDGGGGDDNVFVDRTFASVTLAKDTTTGVVTITAADGTTIALTSVESVGFKDTFLRLTVATFSFGDGDFREGTPFGDSILGGPGNDGLFGNDGDDTVAGGGGNDFIAGGPGNDGIDGGAGNDTAGFKGNFADFAIVVSGGTVTVTDTNPADGDLGTDTLTGIEGLDFADKFVGIAVQTFGTENKAYLGSFLSEEILADAGDNFIQTGGGADTVDGGSGVDTVFFPTSGAGVVPVKDGGDVTVTVEGRQVVLRNVETLFFEDRLIRLATTVFEGPNGKAFGGSLFDDSIVGGAGNDFLAGEDGNDALSGGGGGDFFVGGAGNDTLDGGTSQGPQGFPDFDNAEYGGVFAGYALTRTGTTFLEGLTIVDLDPADGDDGTDTVSNMEGLIFKDAFLSVNPQGGLSFRGSEAAQSLVGTDADDFIFGGGGKDTLDGGAGRDAAFFDARVADAVVTLTGDANDLAVTVTVGGVAATLRNIEGIGFKDGFVALTPSVFEFNGNRSVDGTDLFGDSLSGGVGNDFLSGQAGNDTLDAGAGQDFLTGGKGDDSLLGGVGGDVLIGGAGNDTLDGGGDGSFVLAGGKTVPLLDQAVFKGSRGDFTIVPEGAGVFTVTDTKTTDGLDEGTDRLIGVETVVFEGDGGFVRLTPAIFDTGSGLFVDGTVFADSLTGGAVDDFFTGQGGSDSIDGGGGVDSVFIDALESQVTIAGSGATVTVTVKTTGGTDTLTLTDVEFVGLKDAFIPVVVQSFDNGGGFSVFGTGGADTIVGIAANNGLAGNDYIEGGPGNDVIQSGAGADFIFGGTGNDTVDGGANGNAGGLDIAGYKGNFADFAIVASGGSIVVTDANPSDGDSGTDTLTGVEALSFFDRFVFVAVERVPIPNKAGQFIYGTLLAESIDGTAADDGILGGAGNDTIDGQAGNDFIEAGPGNDSVIGGAGADLLVFRAGDGNDTVAGFDLAVDSLFLNGLTKAQALAAATESADGTTIQIDPQTSVTLIGVSLTQLTGGLTVVDTL